MDQAIPPQHMHVPNHLMDVDSGCGNHPMRGAGASTAALWYHLLLSSGNVIQYLSGITHKCEKPILPFRFMCIA